MKVGSRTPLGAESGYATQTETGSDVSKMNSLQKACFNFENYRFPLVSPCFPAVWKLNPI